MGSFGKKMEAFVFSVGVLSLGFAGSALAQLYNICDYVPEQCTTHTIEVLSSGDAEGSSVYVGYAAVWGWPGGEGAFTEGRHEIRQIHGSDLVLWFHAFKDGEFVKNCSTHPSWNAEPVGVVYGYNDGTLYYCATGNGTGMGLVYR